MQGNKEITRKITATETTEMEHSQKNQERVVQGKVVRTLSQLSFEYFIIICIFFFFRNRPNHHYSRKRFNPVEHSNKIKRVLKLNLMENHCPL